MATVAQVGGDRPEHVEHSERHQHGGGQRGERADLEAERHRQPDHASAPARAASAARTAMPAAVATPLPPREAVEHREQVAEEHGERRGGDRPFEQRRCGASRCASHTATKPLSAVAERASAAPRPCCRCAARWWRPGCRSRSRAGSGRPNSAAHDDGEGDRAQQVRGDDEQHAGEHGGPGASGLRYNPGRF